MCIPSSYLSTHGEPRPQLTDIQEVHALDYKYIKCLHNEEGYIRAHLNVDNYKGEGHKMPISEIRYVPDKYFKVKSYDPRGMMRDFAPDGTIIRTYAPKVTYKLPNPNFTFSSFYLFP